VLAYAPQFPIEKGYPRYIAWYRTLFETLKPQAAAAGPQTNE